MEWSDVAACDAVWSPLLGWWGVWHVWKGCLPVSLHCVCRAFAAMRMRDIYAHAGRPYLRYVSPDLARRTVLCEYAARTLVRRLQTTGRLLGIEFAVAGGFAAWQLERCDQASRGKDSFPHVRRGTTIDDGMPRNGAWIPGDIDVFFSGDAELALPLVQTAYRAFCQTLFGTRRRHHTTMHSVAYEWCEMETYDAEHLRGVMREYGFPESMVTQALDSLERAKYDRCLATDTLLQTWRMSTGVEFMYPTELNLVQTHAPEGDYATWIMRSFDLAHVCVSLEVDDEGDWVFSASEDARGALLQRKLVFHASRFRSLGTAIVTVRRLIKYHMNGFSFLGDDAI